MWVSFDMTVYAYLYVYIGTYLLSGSFDTEVYIYMGIYIWKYLDRNLEPRFTFCIYNCGVGLK